MDLETVHAILEFPLDVNKAAVGIHDLLTCSFFGGGILRSSLLRVPPVKPTSAPLRCLWPHGRKPQFGPRRHQQPRETRRGAGAVPHATSATRIFQQALPPPLLLQELRRCDPLDAMLQPLVLGNMACRRSRRLPDNCLLFLPRSTRYLPWCDPKRYAPNRGESLLRPANSQDCDALKVQSHPTRNVPLPKVCPQPGRETKNDSEQGPMRRSHSVFLLMRSLPPSSPCKRRFLRDATGLGPDSTDNRRETRRFLRPETVRLLNARAERQTSRIARKSRNRPENRAWPPKRDRLLSVAQHRSAPVPASRFVWQPAVLLSACRS